MFGSGGEGEGLRNHQPGSNFHGYNCTESCGTGASQDTYPKHRAQRGPGVSSSSRRPWEMTPNRSPLDQPLSFLFTHYSPPPGIAGDRGGEGVPVTLAVSGMGIGWRRVGKRKKERKEEKLEAESREPSKALPQCSASGLVSPAAWPSLLLSRHKPHSPLAPWLLVKGGSGGKAFLHRHSPRDAAACS